MTDKINYKVRHIRLSENTWQKIKKVRWKSEKSWNLFVLDVVALIKKHEQK